MKAAKAPTAWQADAALAAVTFIWGCTFVVVKGALEHVSTVLFLALRFTLASAALAIAFRPLPGKFLRVRSVVAGGALAGVCLCAAYLFQTFGLRYTSASKSAFITGLSIVLVPVLAAIIERKPPNRSEIAGVAVAMAGMGLLTLQGLRLAISRGDLLTLGCAFGFALHIIVVGHYAPRLGFQGLALIQVVTTAVLCGAAFAWVEPPVLVWQPNVALALLVTGLLATALAFSVQAWAQQYTTPTHTALIFALEPVFAWMTSFAIAGETLSTRAAAGALLILGGILLVELKPLDRRNFPRAG